MSGATTPNTLFRVVVGTQPLVVNNFDVVSGSYGSVGHASMQISRRLLTDLNFDLLGTTSQATSVPVTLMAQTASTSLTKIFDGDVLATDWDMDADQVVIHARDHAGVFVDQKRVLTRDAQAVTSALTPLSPGQTLNPTGVSTVNRKVSQVVSDIAQQFGYTPVLNMGDSTDITAGAQWGSSDHVYMTIPQNLWEVLNTLARDTGNEVYTTPDRKLVFGTPGANLPQLSLSWNVTPDQIGSRLPCNRLKFTHNPRRNATFRVLVFSYMPGTATATIGRATYIAANSSSPGSPEGLYVGNDALSADQQLLSNARTQTPGGQTAPSGQNLSSVQLYTFHWDGLSNDNCNARAAAIATDISKRFLQITCWIDGLPTITPTQKFTVTGPLPQEFSGNTWYISGYQHTFKLPRGSGRAEGYHTILHGLDLPNNALTGKSG